MKKCFTIAMLIVGTIIGAGFATGRELISFFGINASPITAILCAIVIFILCVLFLFIGSKLNATSIANVNIALVGKFHLLTDIFLLVNNFIVLSSMLAGMDTIGNMFFFLSPIYSLGTGVFCALIVSRGMRALLKCNKIIVPIIIVLLSCVCVTTINMIDGVVVVKDTSMISVIVYVCMNMMLASTVLTTMGSMEKKTIVLSSAIASIIMGTLIFLSITALNLYGDESSQMPLLQMAQSINPIFYVAITLTVATSIFTTMLTAMGGLVAWFSSFFSNRFFSSIVVLLGGHILSNLGFSNVISLLYPLIGILGVVYTLFGLWFAFRVSPLAEPPKALFKQCNAKIHKPCKHTKNNG